MTPQTETRMFQSLTEIKTILKGQNEVLEKLDHTVNGNGNPGLKTTVDRHEQTLKVYRRVLWAIVAPGLAALGVGLVSLANANKETSHEANPPLIVPGSQPARVFPVSGQLHSVQPGVVGNQSS